MYPIGTVFVRYHHYRNWTAKDLAAVGCGMVLYIVLKLTLPKIFRNADEKLLDRISWGAAIVTLFALAFAI